MIEQTQFPFNTKVSGISSAVIILIIVLALVSVIAAIKFGEAKTSEMERLNAA
ncbi:MAG TPA: hypothetical protein VF411_03365 [Bacteroidia bacterium]